MTNPENTTDKAQADKVAEGFIAFGQLLIALGVVAFAIIVLISML